jgi:hypothetical protein
LNFLKKCRAPFYHLLPTNGSPIVFTCTSFSFAVRINKKGSQKDMEQKASGAYFFYQDSSADDDDDVDDDDI